MFKSFQHMKTIIYLKFNLYFVCTHEQLEIHSKSNVIHQLFLKDCIQHSSEFPYLLGF